MYCDRERIDSLTNRARHLGEQGASNASASHNSMVDEQHHDRADDCDKHAVDIEPTDTCGTELGKQKTADYRSDYSEHYGENNPLARLVDYFTGYEACNQPQN
jgi:hypothetical protein